MEMKAISIVAKLQNNGYKAVFAGGFVRDMLLNIESHDIDIATSATPDQVEELFENTIAVGKSFGVIIVVIDHDQFEIATFRSDGIYLDGRRPTSIQFSSMEEDAHRRDLTINGMFYDPINKQIYDFVNGQQDLENQIIRFIGNPEDRISEDKLRMLRCLRFSTRFNFKIDPLTIEIIKKHAEEVLQVSNERIFQEIVKGLRLRKPRFFIELLFATNLIDYISPEIKSLESTEQPPEFHPEGNCLEHTIKVLENLPEDSSDELLIGALLHDIGKPKTMTIEDRIRFTCHDTVGADLAEQILKSFHCSSKFIDSVYALVKTHMKFIAVKNMKKSTLKKFIRVDGFDDHMKLHKADCLGSNNNLENYNFLLMKIKELANEPLRPQKLIDGRDLMALGFTPGPNFSRIINAIEDLQLEGSLNTKEEAIEYIKLNSLT